MLEEEILRKPDLAEDKLLARMRKVHTLPAALRTAGSSRNEAWLAAAAAAWGLGSASVSETLWLEYTSTACPLQLMPAHVAC